MGHSHDSCPRFPCGRRTPSRCCTLAFPQPHAWIQLPKVRFLCGAKRRTAEGEWGTLAVWWAEWACQPLRPFQNHTEGRELQLPDFPPPPKLISLVCEANLVERTGGATFRWPQHWCFYIKDSLIIIITNNIVYCYPLFWTMYYFYFPIVKKVMFV